MPLRQHTTILPIIFNTILVLSALYAPQPLLPVLSQEFSVSREAAAALTTVTFIPLALAPLFYGYLLETVSPIKMLKIAVPVLAVSEVFFCDQRQLSTPDYHQADTGAVDSSHPDIIDDLPVWPFHCKHNPEINGNLHRSDNFRGLYRPGNIRLDCQSVWLAFQFSGSFSDPAGRFSDVILAT